MFIGDTHFSKHRRGMGIIPVSRWHLSIWPTGCIGRGGARPWIVGSCWTQVLAAKELYKGKEVGIFFNAIVGRPRWCEKSFKASKKCFFVVVVLLIKRVLDKSWVMHLKNSFWQIQMLSEGYSGYSGYSYVSSCIENGLLSLVRCTCVRFYRKSCGRKTLGWLVWSKHLPSAQFDKACGADHWQSYNPKAQMEETLRSFERKHGMAFQQVPENHGIVSLAKFQSLFLGGMLVVGAK